MEITYIDKKEEDLLLMLRKGNKKAGYFLYETYKTKDFDYPDAGPVHKYEDAFEIDLSLLSEETLLTLHQYTNWAAPSYFLRKQYYNNLHGSTDEQLLFLVQCSSKTALELLISRQTDYLQSSDEVLVLMSQQGNDEALNVLIERYMPFVRKTIRRLERKFFFRGFDSNDLVQEGVLGLFKSKDDYKIERKTKFVDFSKHVIEKHIGTLILRSSNYKNKVLNESFSYHSPIGTESEITFEQLLKSEVYYPEDMLMKHETYEHIWSKLTPLEQRVLEFYSQGLTYEEIGESVGKKKKAIDNTIQRIRKKGKLYKEQNLGMGTSSLQ